MAWIIRGVTKCPVCGNVIEADDEVAAFPPLPRLFSIQTTVELFSDRAGHLKCFLNHPKTAEFLQIMEEILNPDDPFYGAPMLEIIRELQKLKGQE